jgi:SET domain-containing protein
MVLRRVAGRRRLFLFASRDLAAGEELLYDYKLSAPAAGEAAGGEAAGEAGEGEGEGEAAGGGGEEVVECRCGAPHCRGFL